MRHRLSVQKLPEKTKFLFSAAPQLVLRVRSVAVPYPCCVQLLGTELAASRLGRGYTVGSRQDWLESQDRAAESSAPPWASLSQHSPREMVLEKRPLWKHR